MPTDLHFTTTRKNTSYEKLSLFLHRVITRCHSGLTVLMKNQTFKVLALIAVIVIEFIEAHWQAILISLIVLAYTAHALAGDLPDPKLTPGVSNPNVTQANIGQTICVSGWTKTIRPSVAITNRIKTRLMHAYGLDGQSPRNFELDHLQSLEIGGNPQADGNLWPQSWTGKCNARQKDRLETKLKYLICAGTITLTQAQSEISSNWITAYAKYVDPKGCQ